MKARFKSFLIATALISMTFLCFAGVHSTKALWLDFDMKNIPEPKERSTGYYDAFFKGQVIEQAKQITDMPRWMRLATGNPKQASNVNDWDEVPNSSWYTNRHHLHRMSIAELQRGPNKQGPDFSSVVITKAKASGVTPGFMVKDAAGQAYLIKFDNVNYPNLQSGAEAISTRILYAAGYNVPENFIAFIDTKNLSIGNDVQITDSKTGKKRPLTRDDVDEMLWRAARKPDGRYRVLASKFLPGKTKGPFVQVGLRVDDPNDLIPHEHRRELRALRVIGAWINNWDLKEAQSMDMYVEEDGRKFLRHYLLDFGSSLGASDNPTDYFHGHEYGLDIKNIGKEMFSLGTYESPNEKKARIISSEIGNFTADDFDPGSWSPTFPSVMLDNLTDLDAYWATRVMLSFTPDDLRAIIATAEYDDPKSNDYMLRTLLDRQKAIALHWLRKGDALSSFSVKPDDDGVLVAFRDVLVDRSLALAEFANYTYQVQGAGYKSSKQTVAKPGIKIGREVLAAAVEHAKSDSMVEVRIWTRRQDFISEPVSVFFDWSPTGNAFTVRRISRG